GRSFALTLVPLAGQGGRREPARARRECRMRQCVARTRNRHGGAPEASPLARGRGASHGAPRVGHDAQTGCFTRHPCACRRSAVPLWGSGNDATRPAAVREGGEKGEKEWK